MREWTTILMPLTLEGSPFKSHLSSKIYQWDSLAYCSRMDLMKKKKQRKERKVLFFKISKCAKGCKIVGAILAPSDYWTYCLSFEGIHMLGYGTNPKSGHIDGIHVYLVMSKEMAVFMHS